MGKKQNAIGNYGRAGIKDRSEHWKHGKSSGNGLYQTRIALKKARRARGGK